jgi:hypothetical protein
MLPMFHTREELSLSGSIALQLVGDEHAMKCWTRSGNSSGSGSGCPTGH